MTVSSTYTPPQYTGSGITGPFAFNYQFFNLSDLVVNLFDTTAGANVSPQPVLNGGATYDYTITATADANTGEYPSAAINFNNGPPANYRITITRAVPYTQPAVLINNAPFPAKTVEARLDALTLLTQQLLSSIAFCFKAPTNDPTGLTYAAPVAAARVSSFPYFDANGNLTTSTGAVAGGTSGLSATSTTSNTVGTGTKTFTATTGKNFAAGQFVTVADAANAANYMHGAITSYDAVLGTLVVNVLDIGGSGTKTSWNINVSGTQGSIGATGPAGGNLTENSISGNTALTAANTLQAYVATAALNLTIAQTTTLSTAWMNTIFAQGGAVTLIPNAADSINGGTAGQKVVLPQGSSATIETDAAGNLYVTFALGGDTVAPQGRLTLTTGVPVMTADATAQSTVYYTPYQGSLVPIYNSKIWQNWRFAELSLALDSASGHTGYQQSAKNFDLFVFNNAGVLALGTGPAWSSDTARGTGAGTTELQQLNGIWTNKNSIALKPDSTATQVTVPANQATYVGTLRATADGQTGMAFKPTAAGGGTANILGLYNAYNRARTLSVSRDNTSNWSYTSSTWRAADNSNSNRVSWIDGLQQSPVEGLHQGAINPGTSIAGTISMGLDSTSAVADGATVAGQYGAAANLVTVQTSLARILPQIGFHYLQALEAASGASVTFDGAFATGGGGGAGQTQMTAISLEL